MKVTHPTTVLGIFLLTGFALRFISFFPTVIDHDESTYIVIADLLMKGYTYQVDFIDTKPIGIFLVFAALQELFGNSIMMLRAVATVVIALTSFFLYKAKRQNGSSHSAALAVGIIYIFLNSIYTRYGVSPNTETYFNLFTAIALWLYFSRGEWWKYGLAGLSLGVGFILKYVVLFDGVAFGLFLLWLAYRKEYEWKKAWLNSILMAGLAALPFLLVLGYYYNAAYLEDFWFHTFVVSGRYPSSKGGLHYLEFFFQFFLRYLPITVFFILALWSKHVSRSTKQFGIFWSLFVLMAVLIPGNSYGHYFIQFMLPFSFLAGSFFEIEKEYLPRWIRWVRQAKIGYGLLGLLFVAHLFFQKKDYLDHQDHQLEAANYLNAHLEEGDRIYMAEDHIVYHLTDQVPLTKYVHPSLFWEEKHIKALEMPLEEEINRIKTAKPRYLLFRLPYEDLKDDRFDSFRENYYHPVDTIGDDFIIILERNTES